MTDTVTRCPGHCHKVFWTLSQWVLTLQVMIGRTTGVLTLCVNVRTDHIGVLTLCVNVRMDHRS